MRGRRWAAIRTGAFTAPYPSYPPTIAAAIVGDGPTGWMPVALLTAVAATVAGLCALTARETAHVPLPLLGTPAARDTERELAAA